MVTRNHEKSIKGKSDLEIVYRRQWNILQTTFIVVLGYLKYL